MGLGLGGGGSGKLRINGASRAQSLFVAKSSCFIQFDMPPVCSKSKFTLADEERVILKAWVKDERIASRGKCDSPRLLEWAPKQFGHINVKNVIYNGTVIKPLVKLAAKSKKHISVGRLTYMISLFFQAVSEMRSVSLDVSVEYYQNCMLNKSVSKTCMHKSGYTV